MRTKTLQLREEDGYKHTVLCEHPFFFPTAFPPSHKKKLYHPALAIYLGGEKLLDVQSCVYSSL